MDLRSLCAALVAAWARKGAATVVRKWRMEKKRVTLILVTHVPTDVMAVTIGGAEVSLVLVS